MTRPEFEAFMAPEKWTPEQIKLWRLYTPICDVETFKSEMSRPDGMIEVQNADEDKPSRLSWWRFFKKVA